MKQVEEYLLLENEDDINIMMLQLMADHRDCVDRALYIVLDTETKPQDGHPLEDALRWWGKDPGYPFLYIVGWSSHLGHVKPSYYLIPEALEHAFAEIVNYANGFTFPESNEAGIRPIEWVMFNRTFDLGMVEFSRQHNIKGTTHEAMTAARVSCFLPDWWKDNRLKSICEQFIDPNATKPQEDMNHYKAWYARKASSALTEALREVKWTKTKYEEYRKNEWELPFHVEQVVANWQDEWPELTWDRIPEHLMLPYGGNDGKITLMLFYISMKLMHERGTYHIYQQEQELYLNNTREQTITGWAVDRNKISKALKVCDNKIKTLTTKLREELDFDGCPTISDDVKAKGFNPNSLDQIKKLFEYNGLPLPNLQAATLLKWKEYGNGQKTRWAESIQDYLDFKLYDKLNGTYVAPLMHWSQWDGLCHASVRQDAAYTGRQSVTSPPLQTIPRKEVEEFSVRDFFIPRSKDYRLWMFDFSGMEVAVYAEYCRDPIMLDALKKGADFHSMLAMKAFEPARTIVTQAIQLMMAEESISSEEGLATLEVFHVEHRIDHSLFSKIKHWMEHTSDFRPAWKKFKSYRQAAKTGMFAILYGAGPDALSEQMSEESGLYISLEDAAEFKRSFYELYQKGWAFAQSVQETISLRHATAPVRNHNRLYGWIRNKYGRLYLMEPRDGYKGVNYLVQGTCADLLKKKIIAIHKMLKAGDYKSRIVLSIHDELVFELHKTEEQVLVPIIKQMMEDNPELEAVKLKAEASYCSGSWATKKEFDGNWDEIKKLEEVA